MSPIQRALASLSRDIARHSMVIGEAVDIPSLGITDRDGQLKLHAPGLMSANRACGLVRAADGWIAINLAREEDRELAPAWLRAEPGADLWAQVRRLVRDRAAADLIADAILFGLPAARVGEVMADSLATPTIAFGLQTAARKLGPLRVIDLSALWAGPMCGAVLAHAGADVTKVESLARPDPTRASTPEFFRRLNGRKSELGLDFGAAEGRGRLRELFERADVVITSARPRAFAGLGLSPDAIFAANPTLVWVAITGYGWTGAAGERVAFGDDAAAAGGLVRWTAGGEPRFQGDALSDPVTGLAAALGALQALATGGGVMVDAAMARAAAGAAAMARLEAAA